MASKNRFVAFVDPEEAEAQKIAQAAQQKKQAAQKDANKKGVIKKTSNAPKVVDGDEFEKVDTRAQTAGGRGQRGGRGRGGNRGERGEGRGDRGGRGGRGGDRGGRGRGGRPRTALAGKEGGTDVERAERGGQRERFQGKAREDAHPMDRRDGTGKARRGDRKGGNSKGGWGGDKATKDEAKEETKEATPAAEESKEPVAAEPEPVEEEEEVGYTLDDYFADKAATSTGILNEERKTCLLYTSPSPRDRQKSRMPSSA